MKAARLAVLIALLAGATASLRAADRVGPAPSDMIYPREGTAAAADDASATPGAGATASSGGSLTGGLLPATGYIVILGLLVAGAWVLIKRGSLPRPFQKGEGRLKVLETRLLGNRQFLIVVEYDEAKMLLGVCQGRIDYLTPLAGHPLAASAGSDEEEPATASATAVRFGERA